MRSTCVDDNVSNQKADICLLSFFDSIVNFY